LNLPATEKMKPAAYRDIASKQITEHKLSDGGLLRLEAGPCGADMLLLGGRPIAEPIAQYGPFVMNTQEELEQAFRDYQSNRLVSDAA
jgi:redox-sensitive bicupin YhaK (pirin superfamily)